MARRGKGEGNIRERSDGRWEATITVGYTARGNPKRVSVYGRTREEVARKHFQMGAKHGQGLLAAPDRVTVAQYLAAWLEGREGETKPTTLAGYKTAVAHVTGYLGRVRLQSLSAPQIQNMYTQLRKPVKLETGKIKPGLGNGVHHVHRVFRAALNDAVKLDILVSSPLAKLNAPSVKRSESKVWTDTEALQFLESAAGHRWFGLFWLALTTGMRRGELLGLRWEDISLERKVLHVRRNLTTLAGKRIILDPKTHRSSRPIHLSLEDVRVLEDHKAGQDAEQELAEVWQETGWVFCTGIGTTITPGNLSRAFKDLIEKADVPDIRFHDLRHSSASLAAVAGVEPKVLSERLGHATVGFTMSVYQHAYAKQHEQAADAMGALLKTRGKR
jgi:integrase